MKWKSLSPDVRRRDSPKFEKYSYNPSGLNHSFTDYKEDESTEEIMKKFREIERLEREQLERRQRERLHQFFNQDHHRKRSLYEEPVKYDRFQVPLEDEDFYLNQVSYNNNDREAFEDRENNFNSFNEPKSTKRSDWLIDDEDEDELYFNQGHGKKSRKNSTDPSKIVSFRDEASPEFEEYDPKDFAEPSSSWSDLSSSEDEATAVKINKKGSSKKTSASKSSHKPAISSGNKPKAYAPKFVDIDAPTFIKLPPNPIPNTWAHIVHNPLKVLKGSAGCREILTESVLNDAWLENLELVNSVQGIYMRPPFSERFTIENWAKFMKRILPVVMEDGYLFVWVQREELAGVIREAERLLSFKYVENLCWVRRDLGNKLMKEPLDTDPSHPTIFFKSKLTLLILRRDPNNTCKLRHQRNPDCIFDFAGLGRMPDGRAYDVIETLLDGTRSVGPHLMHLWAGSSPTDRLVYRSRKHWIRILEEAKDDEIHVQDEDTMVEAFSDTELKVNLNFKSVHDESLPEGKTESLPGDAEPLLGNAQTTECTDNLMDRVSEIETTTNAVNAGNSNSDNVNLTSIGFDPTPPETEIVDISPESENMVVNNLKPIDLLSSTAIPSTFDDDFNNFITSEPINNYQWS